MSGGSFNYLHTKEADQWVGFQCTQEAEAMIDAMIEAGADDAAMETRKILAIADGARVRLEALIEHMAPIWKAMERWKSNDTSQEMFAKALAKWRGEPE